MKKKKKKKKTNIAQLFIYKGEKIANAEMLVT